MQANLSASALFPRKSFLDRNSKEVSTGLIKEKYKLIVKHQKDLGQFLLFVLNGSNAACVRERTVTILKADWEIIMDKKYLSFPASYIDVQTHAEVTTENEVLNKLKIRRYNAFEYVALLSQLKYQDLLESVNDYLDCTTPKTVLAIKKNISSFFVPKESDLFKKYNI